LIENNICVAVNEGSTEEMDFKRNLKEYVNKIDTSILKIKQE